MIVDKVADFLDAVRQRDVDPARRVTARAAMLVAPVGFSLAPQSASDNAYMDLAQGVDAERALAQHRALVRAIETHAKLPVKVFEGRAETPDAVFPNNVFATAPGRLVIGAMRHPVRQREAARADIAQWFERDQHYAVQRLDQDPDVVCELTGPLIIDHARGIGYHGLTERLNRAGVAASQQALELDIGFAFALQPSEYHTNVIMSVLAGRALVAHAASFVDPEVPRAIARVYGEHVIWLDDAEKAAFVGNCIALTPATVWMSAAAERALTQRNRHKLREAGFEVVSVAIDEIEKAGGSLRCCVAEIF